MSAIPDAFFQRMQALLGEEFPAFQGAFDQSPANGLRVNTLKLSPQEFERISPFVLFPIPWCSSGFRTNNEEKAISPGKHPYHAAGLYYIQEPSAMAVVEALDPQPGELVLDLAAAPGGKATHLAPRLQGQGALVANEIHPHRVWILAENLERWGAMNVAVINETPGRLADRLAGCFDKVLVDAPCSGEGLFRRNPEARSAWSPEHVEGCAIRQATILESAARLVRPGGRMAYATCTFAPQENEGQIARYLEAHPEFELVPAPVKAGFQPGRPDWAGGDAPAALRNTIRLWPHRVPGEGHFIAILERRGGGEEPSRQARKPSKAPANARELFSRFIQESQISYNQEIHLLQSGSYLYHLPGDLPDFSDLKVIHPGWWLGTVKKDRFEPAHSLALALKAGQSGRRLELGTGETARIYAYLRGDSLEVGSQDKGWTLVTVDGFPLGWGKWIGDVLKNYYPRGLRWP